MFEVYDTVAVAVSGIWDQGIGKCEVPAAFAMRATAEICSQPRGQGCFTRTAHAGLRYLPVRALRPSLTWLDCYPQ